MCYLAQFGVFLQQADHFVLINGIVSPNKTNFYLTQKTLIEKIGIFVKMKIREMQESKKEFIL